LQRAEAKILILGGTREARELADLLHRGGFAVTTSLAGATRHPMPLPGAVRMGGFGSVPGLRDYIVAHGFAAVVDATHPFAENITRNAQAAAAAAGVPLLRLERPAWTPRDGDRWIAASGATEAASLLPPGARAFLTVGRSDLAPFLGRTDISGVVRSIDPPTEHCPAGWSFIQARPPFTVDAERQNFLAAGASHLVSKNSGGDETYAKIIAAREINLPVVMIRRPYPPNIEVFDSVFLTLTRLAELLSP
jgi:precorrin-6A/cobalt-precorrin-6A reductase